jgi:hypothetical protein
VLVRIILWTWFILALVVGRFEWLARLPATVTPGVLVALAILVLAACFGLPSTRTWLQTLDVRPLVLLHVSRFFGGYFLFLYHRGALPYAFAVPSGWGEMVVAFLALLVVFVPVRAELRRHAFLIWNTFGSVDILLAAATAVRIGFSHPWQLGAFQSLPLSILPTFLAPLIIATHVIIFARLGRESPETAIPA